MVSHLINGETGSEKLNNLPKVVWLEVAEVGLELGSLWLMTFCLSVLSYCLCGTRLHCCPVVFLDWDWRLRNFNFVKIGLPFQHLFYSEFLLPIKLPVSSCFILCIELIRKPMLLSKSLVKCDRALYSIYLYMCLFPCCKLLTQGSIHIKYLVNIDE